MKIGAEVGKTPPTNDRPAPAVGTADFQMNQALQDQVAELVLFTGKKVTIKELNGSEQMIVDGWVAGDKMMQLPYVRAFASIVAIDGQKLQPAEGLRDVFGRAQNFRGSEADELIQLHNDKFGKPGEEKVDLKKLGPKSA